MQAVAQPKPNPKPAQPHTHPIPIFRTPAARPCHSPTDNPHPARLRLSPKQKAFLADIFHNGQPLNPSLLAQKPAAPLNYQQFPPKPLRSPCPLALKCAPTPPRVQNPALKCARPFLSGFKMRAACAPRCANFPKNLIFSPKTQKTSKNPASLLASLEVCRLPANPTPIILKPSNTNPEANNA